MIRTYYYYRQSPVSSLLHKKYRFLIFGLFFLNLSYSQINIARQQFNDGYVGSQHMIADQNTSFNINTHVGTDNWDYIATSTNGQIRIVNSDITTAASGLYCLEFKNYYTNSANVVFTDQNISLFNTVTFSVSYQSLGEPDINDDLWLDYSYFDAGSWVNTTVQLVDGTDDTSDLLTFGTNGALANPFTVSIPDSATSFNATIRAEFVSGEGGSDNYYIDDVILQGIPINNPPEAYCQNVTITLDAFGNASITAAEIDNGSIVYVGTPILSLDTTNFTCADIGTNIVTLTVEDEAGVTDTCTATLTVNEYTGPLVAPSVTDITSYCSYSATTPTDISYQCRTISPTTSDPTSFSTPGSYVINWVYYDSVTSNTDTAVQNITLNSLAAPSNIIVNNVLISTATINWDNQLGILTYEVRYRTIGSSTWITSTVTTNSIDLTGLVSSSDYEVQVSSLCSGVNSPFSVSETFTTNGAVYCTPNVPTTNVNQYINQVRFGSLATNINNLSGFDNGYGDYTTSEADVYKGSTETIQINVNRQETWMNVGFAVWIDLNGDGDFSDANEDVWYRGDNNGGLVNGDYISGDFVIPTSGITGTTRMRVAFRNWRHPTNSCDGTWDGNLGEYEDYTINLLLDPGAPQEINITGNNNSIIDGSTLADTDSNNNTDFGTYDIYEGSISKTYIILNNGSLDLNLTGSPIVLLSGSTDFTVTQPMASTVAVGGSTSFTITYNPSTIAIHQATISIDNDDADENPYTFVIKGEGIQTFPDTDTDGIPDNVDLDDDNDGILDTIESSSCISYSYSNQTEVVFLNETFGAVAGTRVEIDAFTAGVQTSYCYEDGTGSCVNEGTSLGDGEYTVYHKIANGDGINQTPTDEIAYWADDYWYLGEDHTPGDINGRMAIFNADENPGVFFEATITGITPEAPITYGFSALNIDRIDAPNIATRQRPEVQIIIYDPNGNLIAAASSGLIPPTSPAGDWIEVSATFTTNFSQFKVQLINSQLGGIGNDLAIDDIFVKQLLCDLDGDGIADIIDLDNDNDGIPNVVELGLPDNDHDATMLNDTINIWADANQNGVHDSYESITLLDSDNDGVPDYIDLDSDNDGIFDNVEYDGLGDIDVNGDGVGDGTDIDDNDPTTEPDGDGLLPIIDLNDDGVANDHGSANYPDPIDSDSDNIPNYLDIDSNDAANNFSNGTDISNTIFAWLDANNDGVIDGNVDADEDGILNALDTDDINYGSPRDLDDKYTLFFDGRNDYVEDSNIMVSGDVSLMCFVRSGGNNFTNTDRIIIGQSNLFLRVNDADNTVSVLLNGSLIITSTIAISNNIWTHIAVTSTSGETILYINGEEEGTSTTGVLATDTSNFTIGRLANTNTNYFKGEIDEVRVFNKALTHQELQRMVYQELDDVNNFNSGMITPNDISVSLGTSLQKYYKMDGFKGDILDNKTTPSIDQVTGAKLYNFKNIYHQTAPLPYVTTATGDWSDVSTWLHGDVWDISEETINKDWSIVHVKHDITTSKRHGTLGLIIDVEVKLEIKDDAELQNSWYLNLEGEIDLHGESQLIQTATSTLVAGANGTLERDQQGTQNQYTYNYWSSPVHATNPDTAINGNESYTLADILMDGTDAANPQSVNFISDLNGSDVTTPIQLADYWIWKFVNSLDDDYPSWQHVRSTGSLSVGEGFTMKGPGTGAISADQNYVFKGVPNNGEITLPINAGNDYLVGNPYPSAIDANLFLDDNTNLDGTLYFWEHYGGNSHNLQEYQGGYGLYNYSGGTPAVADEDVSNAGTATKTPRRFIPVSQGFFVVATYSGNITFENDQRRFVTEIGNTDSWFYRNSSNPTTSYSPESNVYQDFRSKFRFTIKTPENYRRQLLLTIDPNASINYDWGYDGQLIDDSLEDMYWILNDTKKYIIQGIDQITDTTILPLGVKTAYGGIVEIGIHALENVADDVNVYLEDLETNICHNLQQSSYTTMVNARIVNDRFRIVFSENTLSLPEVELENQLILYYNNSENTITILNPLNYQINNLQMSNLLGQKLFEKKLKTSNQKIMIPFNLKTGTYLFKIDANNTIITKKQIINN